MKRYSMTAYGRAASETATARWTVEISSVNRKGLDIHVILPSFLLFLDPLVRKWVARVAHRGSVTVRIGCELKGVSHLMSQLKSEKKRWEELAEALEFSKSAITLPFLMEQTSLQNPSIDPKAIEQELLPIWEKSVNFWLLMKQEEGKMLAQDIQSRIQMLHGEIGAVEKEQPLLSQLYFEKIVENLERFKLNPDDFKKEAVLQASRDDITEELIRLKSHLNQMESYLASSEISVGRTLDFLSQEMGREVGTLMAKAGSSETAKRAVQMKSEVEKIREQVQNIE